MYFTDIFIRRPVFACVLSLIILLIGLRAFFSLPVREYPNIEPSVINISTSYPGATAKLMEGFVTTPLENALGGIEGLDYVKSSSTASSSSITLQFKLDYDITKAVADVSNAVTSVRWRLPQQVMDPVISKMDPSAEPTIYLSFSSNTLDPSAITDYLLRVVQPQLEILPGVAQAQIFGDRQYAMRLWLDPNRMAAHGVTANDVAQALNNNNIQAAPGLLESPNQEISVDAKTDLSTAPQFNKLVLRNQNNYLLRLEDVGHAELGPKNTDSSININGNTKAVIMGLIPQSTANPLNVSKEVNVLFPGLLAAMPKAMTAEISWDESKFIQQSLIEVAHTIFSATVFVVLVIFLFLGAWRAVFIPVVTIPLSIIGICGVMLAMGYTINTLTMLAWVLAIGLVVDDAIVVLENVHRHIEMGEKPFGAALIGTREIGFAVIAMTLTLAAVYAPIGFMTDTTGRLFREFAFTLAGAVIISGFVALTLSPMLCAKFLHHDTSKQGFIAAIEEIFQSLKERYRNRLARVLNHRKRVLIGAGIVYVLCGVLYITLFHELAPSEDQGALFTIINGPTSANLDYTQKYSQQLVGIYNSLPETAGYGIINGMESPNTGFSFLVLKPWNERKKSADQILTELFPKLSAITGIQAFPTNPPTLPGSSEWQPVNFILKTTGSYEELNTAVQKMLTVIKAKNWKLINPDTDLKMDKPQITITIDRNKANALGITMNDIATALNTLLGEPMSSQFEMSGRSYYVIPELYPKYMYYAEQLNNINVRTTNGQLMPLANIVTIAENAAPQSLNHFQQLRSASITAFPFPGYTLGQALDYLRTLAKQTLPENIQFDYSGQSRQYMQAGGTMQATLLFAVVFIFLILAAQFESFRDPLIVMVSVPLSFTGALIAIHLARGTINIYTQIGLVTLIGLISKHGILIVEFANQLQRRGMDLTSAIIEAASLRLRPILMTTAAMIFGALPLALATGAGSGARRQLGYVIVGGMSFGTLLTLFVVPVVYTYLATRKSAQEEN